ncbi:MAG: hypothetical protein R2877_03000 [Bdellovibrionota bacterium]
MRSFSTVICFSALCVALLACSEDDENLSGVEQNFTVNAGNQFSIDEDNPILDNDNVSVGETFDGPTPDEPGSENSGGSSDDDGDGIPNDEDHIPDVCTKMVVTSDGVSSARITLNDDEIYSPNDFHNEDFSETSSVNLKEGDNTIFIRLAGSPGDQINVRFYNCSEDPVELVFETTVTRTAGSPNTN